MPRIQKSDDQREMIGGGETTPSPRTEPAAHGEKEFLNKKAAENKRIPPQPRTRPKTDFGHHEAIAGRTAKSEMLRFPTHSPRLVAALTAIAETTAWTTAGLFIRKSDHSGGRVKARGEERNSTRWKRGNP